MYLECDPFAYFYPITHSYNTLLMQPLLPSSAPKLILNSSQVSLLNVHWIRFLPCARALAAAPLLLIYMKAKTCRMSPMTCTAWP